MGRDTGILKVRESSIAVIKADMVQTNRKSAGVEIKSSWRS